MDKILCPQSYSLDGHMRTTQFSSYNRASNHFLSLILSYPDFNPHSHGIYLCRSWSENAFSNIYTLVSLYSISFHSGDFIFNQLRWKTTKRILTPAVKYLQCNLSNPIMYLCCTFETTKLPCCCLCRK